MGAEFIVSFHDIEAVDLDDKISAAVLSRLQIAENERSTPAFLIIFAIPGIK